MSKSPNSVTFKKRDFKGSRFRCLMLTSLPDNTLAETLTGLVTPHAIVNPNHLHSPRGFLHPDEAKLGETPGFLSDLQREEITSWWLEETRNANTPNWDFVSQCRIGDRDGLILVEAKSHEGEFHTKSDRCGATHPGNAARIREAIADANEGWNGILPGFNLSGDSHYQLSNRFAFAWKLASMGIPALLVYLGCLNCEEMNDGKRRLLRSGEPWTNIVTEKSRGVVPESAWNRSFDVNGTMLSTLISAAEVNLSVSREPRIPR